MDFVVVFFVVFVSFVLIFRNSVVRVCVLPVLLFTAFSVVFFFQCVVLLLKRVLNALYLVVVFLTRLFLTFRFPFSVDWIRRRERERETTEEDVLVCPILSGAFDSSKSWINKRDSLPFENATNLEVRDKNETL
jgi:hypothetical protein